VFSPAARSRAFCISISRTSACVPFSRTGDFVQIEPVVEGHLLPIAHPPHLNDLVFTIAHIRSKKLTYQTIFSGFICPS
jgi:hypothetical protein